MSSLYDVQCRFSLPAGCNSIYTDKKVKLLSIQSINKDIIAVTNNQLLFITNNATHCLHRLEIDYKVDTICWSNNGKYISLVDVSGTLYILTTSLEVLLRKKLSNNEYSSIDGFVWQSISFSYHKGFYSVIVTSSNGKIFFIKNIDLETSIKDITKMSFHSNEFSVDTLKCHEDGLISHLPVGFEQCSLLLTSGYGTYSLAIWKPFINHNKSSAYDFAIAVKKANLQSITKEANYKGMMRIQHIHSFVFCTCNNGLLYQFALPHLVLLRFWLDISFWDFTIRMPENILVSRRFDCCRIYSIENSSNSYALGVYTLKNMKKIFTTNIGFNAAFITSPNKSDEVFFVDGVKDSSDQTADDKLRILNLSETSPDTRLFVMLQLHKFEEAIQFAEEYKLNLQPVYQKQASFLFENLISVCDSASLASLFNELQRCIDKITDDIFIGELCVNCPLDDVIYMFKFLKIARDRLDCGGRQYRASVSDQKTIYTELSLEVDRLMDLLVTYQMAFGKHGTSKPTWQQFQSTKLAVQVASLLHTGKIEEATVICSRHQNLLIADLETGGSDQLRDLLSIISEEAKINQLVTWLEFMIPAILTSSISNSVEIMTDWLYKRTLGLEDLSSDWLDDGIKLASVFFTVQKNLSSVGCVRDQLSSTYLLFSNNQDLLKLKLLASRLQMLKSLRSNYNCTITLAEFIKETTITLTFRMIDKVTAPELISKCLDNTVRPYMKEHKLDEDGTLLLYIKDLLGASKQQLVHFRSLKERKVIAIINCLNDEKVIVESTLLLAKKASIPWSRVMQESVQKAMALAEENISLFSKCDDDTKDLFSTWKSQLSHCVGLEKVPAIASKYDIGVLPRGKVINHDFLARRIVKDDRFEAIDDAEKIASIFSSTPKETVYSYRLHYLIENHKIPECLDLLDSQPDIADRLVQRILIRTFIMLERTNKLWKNIRESYCVACISMLEHLLQHRSHDLSSQIVREWAEDLTTIKNIYNLQVFYDEYLSVDDYNDHVLRDKVLACHVYSYYANRSATDTTSEALVQSDISDISSAYSSCANNSSFFTLQKSISKNGSDGSDASDDRKSHKNEPITFFRLLNLTRLLKIPEEAMLSQIALQAARKCQGQAAIEICKDLFQTRPSPSTVDTLETIAHTLLRLLETHSNIICRFIPDICELVSLVAICCKEKRLVDVAMLFSFCDLSRDVLLGTDLNAGEFLSKCALSGVNARSDRYENLDWLNNWYNETDCLTLTSVTVLPLLSRILQETFDENGVCIASKSSQKGFQRLIGYTLEMTDTLKTCHHITSSLQWIARIESVVASHLTNSKSFFNNSGGSEMMANIKNLTGYSHSQKELQIESLLNKIFFQCQPDLPLAVSLLLVLSATQALEHLNNACESNLQNFSKIINVSCVALHLSAHRGNCFDNSKYKQLLLDATWAKQLRSMEISSSAFLLSSPQWKQKFFFSLLELPVITGQFIIDFCHDYDFDCDISLLRYVEALLYDDHVTRRTLPSISSPDTCLVEYSPSSALLPAGHEIIAPYGKNSSKNTSKHNRKSWEEIKKELQWISMNISDKSALISQLKNSLQNSMSPYDYERLDFVICLLQSLFTQVGFESIAQKGFYVKARQLIGFLDHVKREQPPGEVERQRRWTDAREDFSINQLPLIASEKLPFHPLFFGDASMAWKILSAEASDRTAKVLVPIAKLLNLNPDKLFMIAAENVITRCTQENSKIPLKKQHLDSLQELVLMIKSNKMAVAMTKRISELLPIGQEKVDACELCLTLTSRWRESLPEDSPDHAMVSNAHKTLTWHHKAAWCELALIKYSCHTPDVNALINTPEKLIVHLYKHPSIVRRFHEPGDKYPDIHALVDEIARVHNLDITKLRLSLIVDLLLSVHQNNAEDADDDSTINVERIRSSAMLQQNDGTCKSESDLIKLVYLLTCGDPTQQGKFLLKIIGNHKDKRITHSCRVRALQCLFRVVDDDQNLLSLSGKTADQLRGDLRVLIYLSELEKANFNIPAAYLCQNDKSRVVRSVISSSSRQRNPAAVRAAAEMCREFGSVASDTWTVLLQQLVSLQEVSYLQQLLPDICRIPSVLSLPCLASVWQSCVTLPLVALTPPLDQKQKSVALSSYRFLICCPVLLRIDLAAVAKHFKSVELHVLALACLLISPTEFEEAALKLGRSMSYEIKHQLDDLKNDLSLFGLNLVLDFLKDV